MTRFVSAIVAGAAALTSLAACATAPRTADHAPTVVVSAVPPGTAATTSTTVPDPSATGASGEGGRVARVTFDGDDGPELARLTRADESFTLDTIVAQLDIDLLELRAHYYDNGELLAVVELASVEDHPPFVDIAIHIARGPRFTIGKVSVTDTSAKLPLQSAATRKIRAELPGGPFGRGALVDALSAIRREYENTGHADVDVDVVSPKLDAQKPIVDVVITVKPGPLVQVDHIEVVGNVAVPKAAIMHHVALREAGLYNADAIDESVRRLTATGLFSDVFPSYKTTAPGHRTVTFEVREGTPEPLLNGRAMVDAAQRLRLEGRKAEARALLARIARRFPYSKVAKDAAAMTTEIDAELAW